MTHTAEVQHASMAPATAPSATTAALREFTLDLREARRAEGDPSYAILVKRMERQFSKATISRMLNGARPSWPFTRCFLRACGVSDAAITGIWWAKWTRLQSILRPLEIRDSIETADAGGAECTICGGWATNTLRHKDYHRQRGDYFLPSYVSETKESEEKQ
jgi:hypothetical protein